MQFLNLHLLYTSSPIAMTLIKLPFLLSYKSICPDKKLSLFLSFPLEPFLNQSTYLKESIQ